MQNPKRLAKESTQCPNKQHEKQKEVIRKAIVRVSKILKLSQKELSEILGPSESTICRLVNFKNNAYIEPDTKEWDLAIVFLRMYRSLDSLFGGHETQCQLWFNSPNNDLNGTPRKLIKKVEGLVRVTQYLDAYRGLA